MANSKGFRSLSMAMTLVMFSLPGIVYAQESSAGWEMPDTVTKEMEQGQKLLKEAKNTGSNAATFAACILWVPFVGPNKVLKDDECRKSVKSSCRISSMGVPKPWKCAVFPLWAM